jgi:RNA polymerase sigma factor for flagellar operon FliA
MPLDEREETIRTFFPLVKKIARRIHTLVPSVDLGDLVGDGSVGLIRAVDQYDASRGIPLEHYARALISGAMLNGIRRMDPVSERIRRVIRDGEAARYRIAIERGSVPRNDEIEAVQPGFIRASSAAQNGVPLSLDAPLPDDVDMTADWSRDPARVFMSRTRRDELRALIDRLPERQREVMYEHYYGERTLREIGARLNISSQRASQLHVNAIGRLRSGMRAQAS